MKNSEKDVQICSALQFQSPSGFSESLGVFFRLWEHPQTAELDKPHHFAVTSLGLTSGLGLIGQVWIAASHPFASPFPFATHVSHPNNCQVNPKLICEVAPAM